MRKRQSEDCFTTKSNCLKCITFSSSSGKAEGFLHSIEKEKLPFQTLHVDHYGPLEKTGKGFKFVLSVADAFTKFFKLYACKTTSADEVIKHLKEYFRYYSRPVRVVSDRGSCFTSQAFGDFLRGETIGHVLVAVNTPRANGQVERFHRTLTPMLAKLCESPDKWDKVLDHVEFCLNNTVSRAIGSTPCKLLFGMDQRGIVNDELKLLLEFQSDVDRNLVSGREVASENIEKIQAENEKMYNQKRKPATKYVVGDYVMIKNVDTTPGVNKKLIPKFRGPYEVQRVLDNDRYVVVDVENFQVTQRPYNSVVAPDQMRHYVRDE